MKLNQNGNSLMSVVIAIGLTVTAGYYFMNSQTAYLVTEKKIETSLRADESLIAIAADLQQFPFDTIVALCSARGAFNTLHAAQCLVAGTLFPPASQPAWNNTLPKLGVRMSFDLTVNANGPICMEIRQCEWAVPNQVLELTVLATWQTGRGIQQRGTSVRRSKW